MTLAMERETETAEVAGETPGPAEGLLPLKVRHERLLALVADLLLENQQLNCKVEQLEAALEKSERGLKAATPWAGMLF